MNGNAQRKLARVPALSRIAHQGALDSLRFEEGLLILSHLDAIAPRAGKAAEPRRPVAPPCLLAFDTESAYARARRESAEALQMCHNLRLPTP